ncbi:MAG: FHA domain-containing protein [Chitinophagaceae bacterium]
MLDIFKKKNENPVQDVKTVRDTLLQFIKERLKRLEGGEGGNIKGLQLFINCSEEDKHMYESAVYYEEQNRFKEDIQKIADDFAIALPHNWTMEITFTDSLPSEATKAPDVNAALLVLTRKRTVHKAASAYIKVQNGEAEKEVYTVTSTGSKVYIGRGKKVQTSDGFFRLNTIAFPEDIDNESNKFVSRQHAHIEYDEDSGSFLLFADEGGVPPRNKVKIRSVKKANPIKLYTTQIGHPLEEGDQILLGESALLEFSYTAE